jgi:hypothetical protein
LVGKKWLENRKSPKPPITENFAPLKVHAFPEIPKIPEPVILLDNPKITERPIVKETPLLFIKQKPVTKPKPHEQEILTKITDHQPRKNQQLTLITNYGEQPTKKEAILLQKIKHLEKQLTQIQTENKSLTAKLTKTEQEKAKLTDIAEQEKKRADNYQQQLKTLAKTLYQ